jgi:predicted outer membrane protein
MKPQIQRLWIARPSLVLTAVAIAGTACYAGPRVDPQRPGASAAANPASRQGKPAVAYWHVWTAQNGVSHQKRCQLSDFEFQSISMGAASSWLDRLSTPGATVLFVVQQVGWVGEWHENPKPQWIVPLSGRWFVETMDGHRVEMGPGDVSFGGDQNTKPDAQGRRGHRSGTVGNQPSINMIVQLEKDPGAGQACGFGTAATTKPQLGPADTYFVTQTSLGTPFQVDSGRLAQRRGGTAAIRSYAVLMVTSHITVNDALEAILKNKTQVPPPTLLRAAYATMISTLKDETGKRFDTDYVRGQVNYQQANAALYQYEIENGADPDLRAFAQQTLPRIQDHLERALRLERELRVPQARPQGRSRVALTTIPLNLESNVLLLRDVNDACR